MSVYVDEPQTSNHGWCHLIADSLEELHAFAAMLHLKRAWFQPRSWPHYDLTVAKRTSAVRKGAIEIANRQAIELLRTNYQRPQGA